MSLTSELARPDSPINTFLARELPDAEALAARYGQWAAQLRRPVRPRADGSVDWPTLGTTIDHRIRVSLGTSYGDPVEHGVKFFIRSWRPGARPPAGHEALYEAGRDLLLELGSRAGDPLLQNGEDGDYLIRLCFVASLFENVYRTGTLAAGSPLAQARRGTDLDDLVALVPAYAVGDITAQLQLAEHADALGWLLGQDGVTCGPVFAGSAHIGGADADLLHQGELIDIKATVRPQNLGVRELYQLAGYLLLDYPDEHRIRVLTLYLSRQGASISWSVTEFLAVLGARLPLDELRQALARTLGPAVQQPTR